MSLTTPQQRLLDRIVIDPHRRFGAPTVRGTRISVADVLGWLAEGTSSGVIVDDYPELTDEDIRACLLFAHLRQIGVVSASVPR